MSKFSRWCSTEIGKAQQSRDYIGAVCRFNGDDELMVQVRNNEYGKLSSPPNMSSDWVDPWPERLVRIESVREMLKREWEPAYDTTAENEVRYWNGIHQAIATGQADYRMESMSLYHSRYVPVGLVGNEWMQEAERKVRNDRRNHVEKILAEATAAKKAGRGRDTAARALMDKVDTEYKKLHGHSTSYPQHYVRTKQMPPGAHAEENLIQIWNSITQDLQLTTVDLFITRMPCPDKSSGFSLGRVVYKEGCMNKLIQLVGQVGSGVTWTITYHERLSGSQEALAHAVAAGFPANATIKMQGQHP